MKDFIVLMYADVVDEAIANDDARWSEYFADLRASGCFEGGSSIGSGTRFKLGHSETPSEPGLSGFVRVRAVSMSEARGFLSGNPIYQGGGTVEIRELPRDE